MSEQIYKQKPIPLKDLQTEQYLRSPGKFYTNKVTNKDYVFNDFKIAQPKYENPFITLQQSAKDSSQSNSYTMHSRVQSEAGFSKLKTLGDTEQNISLPKLNTTTSKANLSRQDNSISLFLKRTNLPSISETNPDLLRSFMKNEYQPQKLDMTRNKKLSHDFTLPYKVNLNEHGTLEKKSTLRNEDYMNNSNSSFVNNKILQKSNSSYIWMNSGAPSQLESPRNQLESIENFKNNLNSHQTKQVRIQTEVGTTDFFDGMQEISASPKHEKYNLTNLKGGLDDSLLTAELIPQIQPSQFAKDSKTLPKDPIAQRSHTENNDTKKKSFSFNSRNDTLLNKLQKNGIDDVNKKQDLNHYLHYLKQNNNMVLAQANLEHGYGSKRMEKNIEDHMMMLEEILHTTGMTEESDAKQKLQKVAQQILKAKKFQSQLGLLAGMKKNRGSMQQRMQFQKDLEKFNNQLSPDHSIFIKEFYYTVQEFIELISSNKRASLMIQQIRGFNPIIKQILFIDDEIRKDLTLEVLEKQIVSVMQFVQLKKENQTDKIKAKLQHRRKGMWFELNHVSVKELQFFYKNLRECVENKNFDNKICMQSQFYQDLDQIEKIIYKYILNTNTDKVKYKNQCFKDLKVAYKEEIPHFVQNNMPLQNLRYWEKHLGKFDMVSDYVREKDQQISNMCKIYQNL